MWRKLMGVVLGIACMTMVAGVADAAAARKARAPKARKATMEEIIRKAVDEAIKDSLPAAGGKYEFTAKRMRPPKNKKWTNRWNQMGQDGWQLMGSNENIYIFQRSGAVDLAAATSKKSDKKAEKAAAADTKKANKEAEKATKEATKETDRQTKKAAKEAEKSAKKAGKTK